MDPQCSGKFGGLGVYIHARVDSTPACSLQPSKAATQSVTIKSYMSEAMVVTISCVDASNATLFAGADRWLEEVEISPSDKRKGPAEKEMPMRLTMRVPTPNPKPVRALLGLEATVAPKAGLEQSLGSCQLTLNIV